MLKNLKKDLNLPQQAITLYKKALSIKNDLLEAHFNLAGIYQSLGEYETSRIHLKKIFFPIGIQLNKVKLSLRA